MSNPALHGLHGLQVCSGCRGDYEDPDVSAMRDESSQWEKDAEGDDDSDEEIPARCERR
jgi:hypothetical protein